MELSIIVPAYNVEKYIGECLDSILKIQDIDYEIIIINDGSIDKTSEIIEKYKKENNRIKVITQLNEGLSSARNRGLYDAKGEYIIFIDSDDYIQVQEFENFFKKVKKDNVEIGFGNYKKYYENEKVLELKKEKERKKFRILEKREVEKGKTFFEYSDKKGIFEPVVWKNLYKTNFLKENELEFEKGLIYEDVLFSHLVIDKAKKVKYYDNYFYIYRQRENSIMKNNDDLKKYNYYKIVKILSKKVQNSECKRLRRVPIALYFSCVKKYKIRILDIEKEFLKLKGTSLYTFRKKLKYIFNSKIKFESLK